MKRIVPGVHSVREALKVRPKRITELWLREGGLNGDLEIFHEVALKNRIPMKRVGQKTLDHQIQSHQGVIAFVEGGPEWPSPQHLRGLKEGFFFAVDSIEDPNNIGSLARSGWSLGCLGILSTKDRSAGVTPAAEKMACGGFEHVPFAEITNLASELSSLKDLGFWVYGLDGEGDESLTQVELAKKSVIVIGSEEGGLKKPVLQACDAVLSIPQVLGAESFNAAVAGAITGYEFRRQRGLSEMVRNSREKL
jgi:23S rRNA (guanosine2251-2'-O)-methyltransferase